MPFSNIRLTLSMYPRKQRLLFPSLGTKCALYYSLAVSGTENVTNGTFWPISGSLAEEVADCLLHDFATDLGNRSRQGNVLGADLDAVLGVPAFLNASIAHQRGQALAFQRRARRMGIEQPHLGNRGCAHEASVFVEL